MDREPLGPSSRRTGLVITELMYNPRLILGVSSNVTVEFIELYNSKPWDEAIGGYSITGSVSYTFAPNTILRAGAYLVVARVPSLVRSNYAITNVVGPWEGAATNGLPDETGTVQLRNRQGAVLLDINYMDSPPWPEAADGTGHSLSLARPSYGEDDYRAWAESDSVGGSPGRADPLTLDPIASVVINEWQNHSDPVDWLELYNHSNLPVDLSGAYLSDDPRTNKFRIPDGTIIQPRGFLYYDQTHLGFELFAGGESIFLVNSNQTRVIDVIDFRGQSNNVSSGRSPDGGPIQYGLARRTTNAPNSGPMRYPVVISEIMYNPISGSNDDEYVEIHNRSTAPVNLNDWEFVVGISFNFTNNAMIPPGAYWVMAKNPSNLFGIYTNLNPLNTFGPYGGTLANGGERIMFAAADYDIVGGGAVEKLNVPVSDLNYGDGGKWGYWSDGQGSSLELIDTEADPHHPSNWADSSDVAESLWTAIEMTVPLGESLGTAVNDSLIIALQGIGECLLDEVEVRVDNGPNLVANGGFESGLTGWSPQGSHDFSTLENEGFAGSKSLHVRAGSRGDNQSNRILSAPFAEPIAPNAGLVSLRAKAKWLRGNPELLLRLHGSATEAYGSMALPRKLGSPGLPNSRRVANAGPAIYDVKHTPVLPATSQPVVVTARATDPQGIAALTLRYRIDPTPTYTDVLMVDDGTSGDDIANDGIYSGTIPGQPSGTMVPFYVQGRDNQNAIGTFPHDIFPQPGFTRCWPNDALARECVVRWDEPQMSGDFATYHLWVTAVNSNRWHTRDTQNNTAMDGTFVYNNSRVIYNALPLYSGSPWHRTNALTGPAGPHRVDYEMNFPDDEPLIGSTDFVLNNPGNPNILTISDLSAVAEQTVYKIFESMGLPHNHRRYIHFFVNGSQRSTAHELSGNFIFEDSQQPNGEMIDQWFPEDAGGQLFKVEDWFEFERNGFDIAANNDADLTRRTVMVNGQPAFTPGTYRFMFRKRSVAIGASVNDFSPVYQLVDAVSPAEDPNSATIDPDRFAAVADWEAWMRHFAIQRTVGNWDSYGWDRGKNDYLYQGARGFVHMPWDIDYSLGLGRPANEPLFASNDPRVLAMFNTPAIVRAYWRAFAELVAGPFSNANLDPFIDGRVSVLTSNNVTIDLNAVAAIKQYIADRHTFLQQQLATVAAPFAVDGPLSFETTNNLVVIHGSAPVVVKFIAINGVPYPVTWTSVTNFMIRLVVGSGINNITLQGLDRLQAPVAGLTSTVTINYTGPVANPFTSLALNEIMFAPMVAGAQFIEIVNRSEQSFDLTGWRMDGVNLTFAPGSIVTNGEIVVLAQNRNAFRAAYGAVPIFAVFSGGLSTNGEALLLVRGEELIDGVRYEVRPPWPGTIVGASLQLIDAAQDNSRPSNWATATNQPATPGRPNSVAATLPPYDPLWLNEVQPINLSGPEDNTAERDPWIELYNAGPTPLSLDGYILANTFDPALINQHPSLNTWSFPPGTTIDPGQYIVVWADAEPDGTDGTNLHTTFGLDFNGSVALVRWLGSEPQITDYLAWDAVGADVSYGDLPDGQAIFRSLLHTPTPYSTNYQKTPPIFINEWMGRNTGAIRDPADQGSDDWFELYNGGTQTIDLGGYYLTDTTALPRRYMIPTNGQFRIAPRGFMLIWADNQTGQNGPGRDLHVNFNVAGGGGSILLYAPDGTTVVDEVTFGEQFSDITEGRYSDGAATRHSMPRATPAGRNSITNYNSAPVFLPVTNQVTSPGRTLFVLLRANDPDTRADDPNPPPQMLTFTLESGPEGSTNFPTGLFRWIIASNQPPGDYVATVRVTDNGIPPFSATTSFTVTVRGTTSVTITNPPPEIISLTGVAGQVTFTTGTIPGRTYRVLYKDDLNASTWSQLRPDFVAANPTVSIQDNVSAAQRFYVVQQVN